MTNKKQIGEQEVNNESEKIERDNIPDKKISKLPQKNEDIKSKNVEIDIMHMNESKTEKKVEEIEDLDDIEAELQRIDNEMM